MTAVAAAGADATGKGAGLAAGLAGGVVFSEAKFATAGAGFAAFASRRAGALVCAKLFFGKWPLIQRPFTRFLV